MKEIEMWLARDKNSELAMYEEKPSKINIQSNGHLVDGVNFYIHIGFPK